MPKQNYENLKTKQLCQDSSLIYKFEDGQVVSYNLEEHPHIKTSGNKKKYYSYLKPYFVKDELTGKYKYLDGSMVFFSDSKKVGQFIIFSHLKVIVDTDFNIEVYENPSEDFIKTLTTIEFGNTLIYSKVSDIKGLASRLDQAMGYVPSDHPNYWNLRQLSLLLCERSLEYKVKDYPEQLIESLREAATGVVDNFSRIEFEEDMNVFVQDYSYGVEFETSYTKFPMFRCGSINVVPLRDGSLPSSGCEFASLPLTGLDALKMNHLAALTLKQYSKVSVACSLHVHIGNYPKDAKSLLALHLTYYRIQSELMDIMPYYLRDQVSIVRKRQNYCEPILPLGIGKAKMDEQSIQLWYENLKTYYMGKIKEDSVHTPNWGRRSWDSPTRYTQLNMVNMFLSSQPNTIEFRLHPPTLQADRVVAWMLICSAICKFAQNNVDYVLQSYTNKEKITLDDIINLSNMGFDINGQVDPNVISLKLIDYINTLRQYRIDESLHVIDRSSKGGGLSGRNSLYSNAATRELENDDFDFVPKLITYEIQSEEDKKERTATPV